MLVFGRRTPHVNRLEVTGASAAMAPMQTVLASSFGLQDVGSATSPDGAVRALPFAPLPLTHMLPSGLSRAQVRGR